MKKKIIIVILLLAAVALGIVFYVFKQETVEAGKYTVLYYKNMNDLDPQSFPADLESLKGLPGLIRITWREQIAPNMFQEYCYLPGKEVEKTRIINKN